MRSAMAKKDSHQDPTDTHALAALSKEVGKPNMTLLAGLVAGMTPAQLVAIGRTIDTKRIVKDTTRVYGQAWAWWQGAGAAERAGVKGLSLPLLGIAVHMALELEKFRASVEDAGATESADRAEKDSKAEAVSSAAIHLRDQAADALRDAAAQDTGLRDAAKAAVGTAESPDALARGLENLGKLLRDWLGRDDADLASRLELGSLDADYADELDAAAKEVRKAHGERTTGARSQLAQGELDRQDGISVLLLGQILRAFDSAHTRNPTVPKLVPISTRRLFSRRAGKVVVEAEGDGGGAEQGAAEGKAGT
jgi:hypothetical protein